MVYVGSTDAAAARSPLCYCTYLDQQAGSGSKVHMPCASVRPADKQAVQSDWMLRSQCNYVLILFQAYTNIHPGVAGGAS